MIQKIKFVTLLAVSTLLFACNQTTENVNDDVQEEIQDETQENLHIGDNSEVSVDWAGTYSGVLPCADCEGIETTLVIGNDGSYELISNYLTGKMDDTEFKDQGMIKWNESGSSISLISTLDTEKRQFKVGENQLFYLNDEGNVVEGELAEHYILKKQ